MKKFLLVMCAVIGLAFGASAQRAQLQIGYGGYTQMDASDMHDYGAVNNAWGALTAGVNFKILPSFSLGLSYTFSSTSYKHIDDANAYYHVFMLNGKYDYWRNSIVRLYAHAGVGVDVTHMAAGDWHKNKKIFWRLTEPKRRRFPLLKGNLYSRRPRRLFYRIPEWRMKISGSLPICGKGLPGCRI